MDAIVGHGAEEIEKRLVQIGIEFGPLKSYNYVAVNKDIREASEQIQGILAAGACAPWRRNLDPRQRSLYEEKEANLKSHDQPPAR